MNISADDDEVLGLETWEACDTYISVWEEQLGWFDMP